MTVQRLNVRGTEVRLMEAGSGEPLVYLHGASGGGEWLPFLDQLAQHNHVYAPEHPGFGESDDLESVESMEDLAYFYLDLMDALSVEKAHLVGSSLGGWLAVEIAAIAPHRVGKLVLMGAAGLRVEGVPLRDTFMMDDAEQMRAMFHDPDLIARRMQAISDNPEMAVIQYRNRGTVAHLAWNPYFHRPQLRYRMHRVHMPTLLIWGEYDGIFPPAVGAAYEQVLPDAKLHVVKDCGHLPAQEKTDETVSLVRQFITEGVR